MSKADFPGKDLAQLLQIPLFRGIKAEELPVVVQAAHRRRVQKGGFFFHQEDPADTYYALVEGRVRVTQLTPEGNQVVMHLVGPGEGFGMIAALSRMAYPASAEALEDCLALAWAGRSMAELMERFPRLALNALDLLASRIHELQERYRELATERVERRVARALVRLARHNGRRTEEGILIDLPLSRQDLAEMTGTTLYTTSRILSGWEQRGLVDAGRERVLIRSPHALVAIAEDLPEP